MAIFSKKNQEIQSILPRVREWINNHSNQYELIRHHNKWYVLDRIQLGWYVEVHRFNYNKSFRECRTDVLTFFEKYIKEE